MLVDLLFHTVHKILKKKKNDPDQKPYFQVNTFTWAPISEIQPLPCFYLRVSELLSSLGEVIGGKNIFYRVRLSLVLFTNFLSLVYMVRLYVLALMWLGGNVAPLLRNLIAGARPSDLFSLWQGIW